MKYKVDSLENQVNRQSLYIESIKKVLSGDASAILDTTLLVVPPDEISDD
jgi:hypothetical protein